MKVTHQMQTRLAVGRELAKRSEPTTPRELGAALGVDLTAINAALAEMRQLRLVDRRPIPPPHDAGRSKFVYFLTDMARAAGMRSA